MASDKEGSHRRLQRLMKKYHNFLFGLYKENRGWKNRIILSQTNHVCVYLVLRLLFCISVGHIPLRYRNFQVLIRSKRRKILASLKYSFRRLQHSPTLEKRRFILRFASLYHILFEPLFEKH